MKKVSIAAANQIRNFSGEKLTIGLDLGDRSNWYCMLDEAGSIVLEQRLSTSPKAMQAEFGKSRGGASQRSGRLSRARPQGAYLLQSDESSDGTGLWGYDLAGATKRSRGKPYDTLRPAASCRVFMNRVSAG